MVEILTPRFFPPIEKQRCAMSLFKGPVFSTGLMAASEAAASASAKAAGCTILYVSEDCQVKDALRT